jgi:hypothetical protein
VHLKNVAFPRDFYTIAYVIEGKNNQQSKSQKQEKKLSIYKFFDQDHFGNSVGADGKRALNTPKKAREEGFPTGSAPFNR